MDQVDITVAIILSDEVSEASKFSIAAQLEELIVQCLERGQIEIPDGSIEDIEVIYDENSYV